MIFSNLIPPILPAAGVGERKKADAKNRKKGKKEDKEIFERLLNTEIDKIRGKA